MRLEGKVAIVTGGGTGIGEGIARLFAREGAKVVISGRTEVNLRRVSDEIAGEGGDVLPIPTDVMVDADIERLVSRTRDAYGPIDILVNNAGIAGPTASILELTREAWEETLTTNLTGVFLATRAAVPDMIAKKRGWIVNMGSVTGKKPLALRTPYSTSKMGLIGFTRTLALELGAHNINVNCICPGRVTGQRLRDLATARAALAGRMMGDVPLEEIVKLSPGGVAPLGRYVEPEEIAELALFLCTDASSNMTGQDINISGGLVMY